MSRVSRRVRQDGLGWRLQNRDFEVLRALRTVRYLSTSQVKRVFFPECRDEQTARRRLRALFDLGLTGRVIPMGPLGNGSPEEVHFLEREGFERLRESERRKGEVGAQDELELESEGVRPRFLEHSLAVAEVWVSLSQALAKGPPVLLERFVADFEIRARQRLGDRTYWLAVGQELVVPDAIVILRGVGEFSDRRSLTFWEVDRATEALRVVEAKAAAFARLHQDKSYRKLGEDLDGFRVQFVTTSQERALNIRRQIQGKPGDRLVWVTGERLALVDLLTEPMWIDEKGARRAFLRRAEGDRRG